jgi:HD-GYP domain-containing protein (c-di-GMP phosphodiesterase class II)
MKRLKQYVLTNFEQAFVLFVLLSVAFLNYALPQKVAFINFYFLPVIVAGYLVGVRLSVLGALFCILMVLVYTVLNPQSFTLPTTKAELVVHLLAWGGFLILAGAAVGTQQDKLKSEVAQTRELNSQLLESYRSVKDARTATVLGLAKLAEYRDRETGRHLERIREYCRIITAELARHPQYRGYITDAYIEDICLSSVLHDIGKVGIVDGILLKPGKLTPDEYEAIKRHTTLGGDTLRAVEAEIRGTSFLTLGKEVAYHHHERWDGRGYPQGMKGEQIPLSARVVAVADVYDAITSDRVYMRSRSHAEALRIIAEERGQQFDPDIVDAFLERAADIDRVRIAMQDAGTAPVLIPVASTI